MILCNEPDRDKPDRKRSDRRSLSNTQKSNTLKLTAPYLSGERIKALQYNLLDLGFKISTDGVFGPSTEVAVRAFQKAYKLSTDGIAGAITLEKIKQVKQQNWNSSAMPGLMLKGNTLGIWQGGDKLATVAAIKAEARRQGITHPSQVAYILATVEHETNGTFQPVEEGYYLGKSAAAHRERLDYYPYYGRGYVQLTWADNYHRYSKLVGIDLINQPDLVMRPAVSLFILIDGMKLGAFTGKKLDSFTTNDAFDFIEARRIINGKDKAKEIASLADSWLAGIAT